DLVGCWASRPRRYLSDASCARLRRVLGAQASREGLGLLIRQIAVQGFVLLADPAEPCTKDRRDLSDPGIRLWLVEAEQLRAVVHDPDEAVDRAEVPAHDLVREGPLSDVQSMGLDLAQTLRRVHRDA